MGKKTKPPPVALDTTPEFMARVRDLVPYARNSKDHPDWQITKIAASIREYGFNVPVLIDADGVLIAGHGRVLAAERLGMEEVPCKRLTHLTEAQVRAYRIADNKTAESEWLDEVLAEELRELDALGELDLELTGLDLDEIEGLISGLSKESTESPGDQKERIKIPKKDPNVLVRLSFYPGLWLGKRQEILGVLDQMETLYKCKIKVEE